MNVPYAEKLEMYHLSGQASTQYDLDKRHFWMRMPSSGLKFFGFSNPKEFKLYLILHDRL